jgi:hypothetical protein
MIQQSKILQIRETLQKQDRKFSIPYKVRSNLFSSSTGHVTFNPSDMRGYSYQWYCLTKRIGGVQVLNNYGYSSTTNKHIWAMRRLFRQLGITWMELSAPQGLQDLNLALGYHVRQLAKIIVANRYARSNIQSERFDRDAIKFLRKNKAVFSLLDSKRTVREQLRLEIIQAEEQRKRRLQRMKNIKAIRAINAKKASETAGNVVLIGPAI